MMTPSLFFDTANKDAIIQNCAELFACDFPEKSILGITTNPSALTKIGCQSLLEFEELVPILVKLVTDIRQDNLGTVHVQLPYSFANEHEIVGWANYVKQFTDGHTRVAMKLPPYKLALTTVEEAQLDMPLNVTGIADAATILLCNSYPSISYASIIPGRMEEIGIDADQHLSFLNDRYNTSLTMDVITGSMRTIDGLKRAIMYNTIPTIGERVWALFTQSDFEQFESWWLTTPESIEYPASIPQISDQNKMLSMNFFSQMDSLGSQLFREFQQSLC